MKNKNFLCKERRKWQPTPVFLPSTLHIHGVTKSRTRLSDSHTHMQGEEHMQGPHRETGEHPDTGCYARPLQQISGPKGESGSRKG